ncbi:MAG: putative zinc ribbon domain protein [Bacteroidetes bacterium ADurb.Bin416]|jgi:predicted  nucleic acid-binding Zn-ribbon protein|nr:MAG: putative zinc ribbon domain protein [Bacteroidetes bacterium ADurb.Bin416]
MSAENSKADSKEITVKEKLKALYDLQVVVSEIDKIKTLRGELPLEVQDLEDDIAGLETRIENIRAEIKECEDIISGRKLDIENAKGLMEKYKEQQDNVRNNREYDFLSKELEFQGLEIELAEKKIREATAVAHGKNEEKVVAEEQLEERKKDLEIKQQELEEIISETRSEEENLREKAKEIELLIEPRLLTAFKRIRKSARNGLAVVSVQRDACSGCFNKIPPQRQMDIKMGKKIIVCEYCGRIMIDPSLADE